MRAAFCAGKLSDIEPRRRNKIRALKATCIKTTSGCVASCRVALIGSDRGYTRDSRAKFRDLETRIVLESRLGISVPLEFKSEYI